MLASDRKKDFIPIIKVLNSKNGTSIGVDNNKHIYLWLYTAKVKRLEVIHEVIQDPRLNYLDFGISNTAYHFRKFGRKPMLQTDSFGIYARIRVPKVEKDPRLAGMENDIDFRMARDDFHCVLDEFIEDMKKK